jgi:ParB family transcriptional regulator, chromosome partitioning protein
MRLEFHQLDGRWEHLRVREPHQQRRLLASLAECGQQIPIIVVADEGRAERYVVIDGYQRIAALQQLGRDTVEATVWALSEAEALLLDRSLRLSRHETALEQGWLLSEMERHFRYSLEELARRFHRSVSWVSRRLALVDLLPAAIQQQVRDGRIAAQVAMRYLVPVARVSLEQCATMAAALVECRCNAREAGQLYRAWREGTRVVRERLLAAPALFLKTQQNPESETKSAAGQLRRDLEIAAAVLLRAARRLGEALPQMNRQQREQAQNQMTSARQQLDRMEARIGREQEAGHVEPGTTDRDSGTEREGRFDPRDRTGIEGFAPERAQSTAIEFHRRAGTPTGGESRALPPANPRASGDLPGESRASP